MKRFLPVFLLALTIAGIGFYGYAAREDFRASGTTILNDGEGNTVVLGNFNATGMAGRDEGAFDTQNVGFRYVAKVTVYDTTTTTHQIPANFSGSVYATSSASSNDPVTFVLPPAETGARFTFVDNNATAAADLTITAEAEDTINGGDAGGSFVCTGDAAEQNLTLLALDSTKWVTVAKSGTWAAP